MVEQRNQPNKHVDDLIDAYALGILEDEGVAEVERHLPGCFHCQQELRRARAVTELLAFAPRRARPPARLKQSILSRIAQESQSSIPLPNVPPARQGGVVESVRQWFGGRRSEPPPLVQIPGRDQAAEQQLQMVLRVLHTPRASIWDLSGTPEAPHARAALLGSPETDTAVLVVSGLASLPPERDYQLWFLRDGQPVGSAVFDVGQNGEGQILVRAPRQLGHYDLAAITPEPAGGSAGPTGPIIIAGQIKAA